MLAKRKTFVKKIMPKTIVNKSTSSSAVLDIETGRPESFKVGSPDSLSGTGNYARGGSMALWTDA